MKKQFILALVSLVFYTTSLMAQCNDFNYNKDKYCVEGITATYNSDGYLIAGFQVNTRYSADPDALGGKPGLSVFIQTGDGNFISEIIYPDDNTPVKIPYLFANTNEYQSVVEVTKIYDGGGPRRSAPMMVTAKSSQPGSPGTTDNVSYLQAFPREIVEEDLITLVINYGTLPLTTRFTLLFDKNIFDPDSFVPGQDMDLQYAGATGTYGKYEIKNTGTSRNLFLRVKPGKGLALYDETAIYLYKDSNVTHKSAIPVANVSLAVLSSHDPNNITVAFCKSCLLNRCTYANRSTIRNNPLAAAFRVNFENTGTGSENKVNVKFFFSLSTVQKTGEFERPVFAGSAYYRTGDMQMSPAARTLAEEPEAGTTTFSFEGELKGTNSLPYGHPSTRGAVGFNTQTIRRLRDLQAEDTITAWGEINFVSAGETIRTNVIKFTVKEFKAIYNKRCICQYKCFLKRWICRLFKRIR